MPAQITSNVKLRDCILMYNERARQNEGEFRRLWRIAFTAFEQMGINYFWEPRTWVLPVDSGTLTAEIPEECLQWIKVGQFNSAGELQTLSINDQLTTFHDDFPTRLTDITSEIQDFAGILQSDLWFNGWGLWGGYNPSYPPVPFGAGSRILTGGSCKVDWKAKIIELGLDYQYSEVVLEGIGAPEMNDDFEIPFQFRLAMIHYLGWQDDFFKPSSSHVNEAAINRKGRTYKAQLKLAKEEYKPTRLQEIYQEAVESYNLGMKP